VSEGGENRGEGWEILGVSEGEENRFEGGEIFGVSEGGVNRGEVGGDIWCVRGRSEQR